MKVFLTLLVFLISINAYVYHRERALEITVDSDGNGFYCFVLTGGKGENNGTAYIRKYLFPPKSGASPFIKYEDVLVPGVNVVKGCTVTTYNQSGQMYLLATFETSPLSFTMMHVPYTPDPVTTVPVFGTMNLWTLVQENSPFSFAGIWNMPQLFNLNGSIILIFMGTETTVSDFRVCYYYYSNLSAWMTNSYRLVNTPAQSIFGYKYGNQDYFSAYVQNGVIKLSIAQNRYPYGTCAVATCITGLVFHEINSTGHITNSTFKTLPNLNLGADSSRPMPGETYHNATTDNYGGVFSNFLSYESFIFTYSCSWNRTENRCYWLASAVALTQKAPVLANDALIYNNNWWIIFIDEGWTIKLYTMPTYWTASTNYYSPRTLLTGNVSTALNSTISLSSDYFERSELSFFQYFSSLGTKIYLTFVNSSYDADIIPLLY